MDFSFKYLQDYDASRIREKLISLPKTEWDLYTDRAEAAHINTKNIVARANPDITEKYKELCDRWGNFFKEDYDDLTQVLEEHYGEIFIFSIVFARLPAGESVLPHTDTQATLFNQHRVHLPIITNDNAFLIVGGECVNLKVNTLTEIDNVNKIHMAVNNGTTDRIHAIIDLKKGAGPNTAFRPNEDSPIYDQ